MGLITGDQTVSMETLRKESEPRVVYQVQCPICWYLLLYNDVDRSYEHPPQFGEPGPYGVCVNAGRSFTFEQPTVRERKP